MKKRAISVFVRQFLHGSTPAAHMLSVRSLYHHCAELLMAKPPHNNLRDICFSWNILFRRLNISTSTGWLLQTYLTVDLQVLILIFFLLDGRNKSLSSFIQGYLHWASPELLECGAICRLRRRILASDVIKCTFLAECWEFYCSMCVSNCWLRGDSYRIAQQSIFDNLIFGFESHWIKEYKWVFHMKSIQFLSLLNLHSESQGCRSSSWLSWGEGGVAPSTVSLAPRDK